MDAETPPPPRAALGHAEIRSIIFGVMLAMLLAALDQTIVATALPTIGRELGDLEHLPWVVTANLVAATAVTPLYGKFSDTHGRRVTLLIGIVTFVVGALACALAPNMLTLILARAIQGLGGGGLISLAQTVIADVVVPKERGRYQVYIASVFLAASLLGPVLGGFFAEHLHWSMIFWINVPLGLAALVIANRTLRRLPRHDRRHRLDVLGAILLVAATVSLMLALSWGGRLYPWLSAEVVALVGASLLLWSLFALRQRLAREPLIPLEVLRNPVVRAGTVAACFAMGVYIGLCIFLPIYFEGVRGMSATQSGLCLIPLMVGTVVGATTSGRAMTRVRRYKRLPIAGMSVAMAGAALLAAVAQDLSLVALEAVLAAISLGLGTLLPVTTVSIQNAVAPHQMGTATGAMNFFRQLGGALIVAVFGAIVLGGAGVAAQALAPGSIKGAALAGTALADSFRWVFVAALAGFAVALAALLAMEERPLRG